MFYRDLWIPEYWKDIILKPLVLSRITFLTLALVAIMGTFISRTHIYTLRSSFSEYEAEYQDAPPLYLPRLNVVKAVTLGYENFTANLLWFVTLNYFGEKFETNGRMPWFSHMCELVTALDPGSRHVFEFCGTLMSWVGREPKRSTALLSEGIKADPNYWRYYYLRAFNYWYFLEDLGNAKADLQRAVTLPNAPLFLKSLLSRLMVHGDQIDSAVSFLQASIENSRDQHAKSALQQRLKEALVARDIRKLEKAVAIYKSKNNINPTALENLVTENILSAIPVDPYGDPYSYNQQTGEVNSVQGRKGLYFPGKTAKTGLAAREGWLSNEQ